MAKQKRNNRRVVKVGQLFSKGNKSCPKCGSGFFMGIHNNRISCGKCGYTEFKK